MHRGSHEEVERALKARLHRQMGMTAAVMGVIAAGVGFWWIGRVFGVTPYRALADALPLFSLVLVLLGLVALPSFAAIRLVQYIERRAERGTEGKQVDG